MASRDIFKNKAVIGMVHLMPLPGSPGYGGSIDQIIDAAFQDMRALEDGGADSFIIENFGDVPYATENEPITMAAMSSVAGLIARETKLPFGINVQFNCTDWEWAMSYVTGAAFIRVEAFVETRIGIHGVTEAKAPSLMRLKKMYPSETMIFADINTKHTFAVCDQPLDFSITEAEESGADALIVTGLLTGKSPTLEDVKEFKALAGDMPVLLGSGVKASNIKDFFQVADGAIIGSSIKVNDFGFLHMLTPLVGFRYALHIL